MIESQRRFIAGEFYEEVFLTEAGWLAVGALVRVDRRRLLLLDISVDPIHAPRIEVGTAEMLKIRRQILTLARAQGYTEVEIAGWRRSGAAPNRTLRLRGKV